MSKTLLYICLLLPGFLALYILLPIGHYSFGLTHGLGFAFFELAFILISLIIIAKQIFQIKNKKFDYLPIGIFLIQISVVYLSFTTEDGKFWTRRVLMAKTENQDALSGVGTLILYKNKSFAAQRKHADYSEVYQSSYTISNDTLYLNREDLPTLTDSFFTDTYIIAEEKIKPIKSNFPYFIIEKENSLIMLRPE